MNFKKGKNTIKPRTLRKLTTAIHDLQKQKSEELKNEAPEIVQSASGQ